MQTVLVTAGAGFIGSHLVPLLAARGNRVRVLDTLAPQIHGMLTGPSLDWLANTPGESAYDDRALPSERTPKGGRDTRHRSRSQ